MHSIKFSYDTGATVQYYEIEAEDATTNGVVIGPGRTYKTLPSEASGRRAVQIITGKREKGRMREKYFDFYSFN